MKRKRLIPSARVAARQPETQADGANGAMSISLGMLDATRARLVELRLLRPDWDSYGALPVSEEAVTAAERMIRTATERVGIVGVPHDIMPIADGGIALEWRYPQVELGLN